MRSTTIHSIDMGFFTATYTTTIDRMGIEKGEGRATQKIALNLLRKNISLATISEVTGLTISELEGFANEQLQQLQASQGDG